MKSNDLKDLTINEIYDKIINFETDLFKLKFQNKIRQIDDTSKIVKLKRNIARYKTYLSTRKSIAK